MIEAIHTQSGYLDLVNFLNSEISSPTMGKHTELVEEIMNWIQSKDYYCFVQELFTDVYNYRGVFFVSPLSSKLLYIENGKAVAYNYNNLDVEKLFRLNETGLIVCYSDLINLYEDSTDFLYAELQVFKNFDWGSDLYFIHLRFHNEVIASGIMQSVLMVDQILTCYNLMIDKTPYATITFKSAKNVHMTFHVEVDEGIFQSFTSNALGYVMTVQDSVWSRRSLQQLSKLGVVFIDF